MKTILRYFIINYVAIWGTTQILPGLSYSGGIKTLVVGALAFMVINYVLVPLLKILLLPLNLLTLGVFAWVTNVLALYALTTIVPQFKLIPYHFPGGQFGGFAIASIDLSPLWVAVLASFLIGFIAHFLHWLMH